MSALTLLAVAMVLLAGRLCLDAGRASLTSIQAQTRADLAALSSLRMRTSSLRAIGQRWQEYGDLYGAARLDGSVDLPAARWAEVELKAAELARALPSYQGRATAVLKVVSDANGFSREDLAVLDNEGARLGLAADSMIVRDEHGNQKKIFGGWLRRLWQSSDPVEVLAVKQSARVRLSATDAWEFDRRAIGGVVRDVDGGMAGKGDFPFTWMEAVEQGRLVSLRSAFYRARLKWARSI